MITKVTKTTKRKDWPQQELCLASQAHSQVLNSIKSMASKPAKTANTAKLNKKTAKPTFGIAKTAKVDDVFKGNPSLLAKKPPPRDTKSNQHCYFVVFAISVAIFAVFLLSFAVFSVFAGFEGLDLHELSKLGVCLAGTTELLLGPVLAFCCFCHFSYHFCCFFVEFCCICCFCWFLVVLVGLT